MQPLCAYVYDHASQISFLCNTLPRQQASAHIGVHIPLVASTRLVRRIIHSGAISLPVPTIHAASQALTSRLFLFLHRRLPSFSQLLMRLSTLPTLTSMGCDGNSGDIAHCTGLPLLRFMFGKKVMRSCWQRLSDEAVLLDERV